MVEQLFTALSKAGFSVFVDRFSVPKGAVFQRYLTEQLEDKSMVAVIETPRFSNPWTDYEVNFSKRRRLGICAINVGAMEVRETESDPWETKSTPSLKSIDQGYRLKLEPKHFVLDPSATVVRPHNLLSEEGLRVTLNHLVREHNLSFVRRRYMLLNDLNGHLALEGLGKCEFHPTHRQYCLTQAGSLYKFVFCPRPADLGTFFLGANRKPSHPDDAKLVVVSPYLKSGTLRGKALDWLARATAVKHCDPLRIGSLALMIKAGKL